MNLIQKIINYYNIAYKRKHFPSIRKILFTKREVFVYHGFLGDLNVGDELVYEAAKKLFSDYVIVPVKRHMPFIHRLIFQTNLYKLILGTKLKGIIIGGGTLIGNAPQYISRYLNQTAAIYIHGTGVHKNFEKEFWNTIFSNSFLGGIRGELSKKYIFDSLGIDVNITGDAAFYLFDKSLQKKLSKRHILVNFGSHRYYYQCKTARQNIVDFLRKEMTQGTRVTFVPFHSIDFSIGLKLKNKLPQMMLLNIPRNFSELTAIFSKATFAIGERLHFSIVASMFRCPFLSVTYSGKHIDFLTSIDAIYAGFNFENIRVENIEEYYNSINRIFDWDKIENNIEYYKNVQIKEKQKLNLYFNKNYKNNELC